jgi:phosphoenolpyruvate synthase/pyruvate phosphate dikinase
VLRGLAVSPGVVRGRARVILRADAEQRVLPGEILVAPFTDPGWMPYFLPAAAIVVDVGGALSHGSIVAREYGIPAVVNVGPATQVIRTGDLIEVDAHCGEVRLLRDAPLDEAIPRTPGS